MDKSQIISNTDISIDELFDRMASKIHSIYLMDCEKNLIVPLKTTQDSKEFNDSVKFEWDMHIDKIIERFMAPQFRIAAKVLFSRDYIQKKYTNLAFTSQFMFQTNEGEWRNLDLIPVRVTEDQCLSCVLLLVDITEVKKRQETMEMQLNEVKRNSENLKNLCVLFGTNLTDQLVKYDVVTDQASLIKTENNELVETPISDFSKNYDLLVTTVHPDDVERLKAYTSLAKIKEMKPESNYTLIYRSKIKDKRNYRWYKTTTILLREETTTAFIASQDITDEIMQNKELFKSLE